MDVFDTTAERSALSFGTLSDQDLNSASNQRSKEDALLKSRLSSAQHEVAKLSTALQAERERNAQLEEMYSRLQKKYSSLKRSVREISGNEELLRVCSPEPGDNAGKQRKLVHGSSPGSPTPEEKTPQPALTPSPLEKSMATPAEATARPDVVEPPAAPRAKQPEEVPETEASSSVSPAKVEATQPAAEGDDSASSSASASAEPADESESLAQIALQLSRQTASQAASVEVGTEGGAADDDEAASLALAMQMMQQEQALAAFYTEAGGGGFGFESADDEATDDEGHGVETEWIPNEEVEVVEADDALAEEDVTYEQLVQLDAQRVVVGITEEARARTTVKTLAEADVAALADDVHAKRCCICLCDYESGEQLRELPCMHGCHMDCMDAHLAQSKMCPICRTEV